MNFLYALWAWLNYFRKEEGVFFYSTALAVIICLIFAPVGTFWFLAMVVGLWAILYWCGLGTPPTAEYDISD